MFPPISPRRDASRKHYGSDLPALGAGDQFLAPPPVCPMWLLFMGISPHGLDP
jgi:hypothetical protein